MRGAPLRREVISPKLSCFGALLNRECKLRAPIESSRRNEAERESQVRPGSDYLARHPLDEEMRSVAISWLLEVVKACNLKHSTLFLAASYFDRFMSVSKVRSAAIATVQPIALAAVILEGGRRTNSIPPPPFSGCACCNGPAGGHCKHLHRSQAGGELLPHRGRVGLHFGQCLPRESSRCPLFLPLLPLPPQLASGSIIATEAAHHSWSPLPPCSPPDLLRRSRT